MDQPETALDPEQAARAFAVGVAAANVAWIKDANQTAIIDIADYIVTGDPYIIKATQALIQQNEEAVHRVISHAANHSDGEVDLSSLLDVEGVAVFNMNQPDSILNVHNFLAGMFGDEESAQG